MKDLYTEALEMASLMNKIGFKSKELDANELEDNGCVFISKNYYLMVYFKPERKIKVYPDVKIDCSDWQDYYESFMNVRNQLNEIAHNFEMLYDLLEKTFPLFKLVKFGGE